MDEEQKTEPTTATPPQPSPTHETKGNNPFLNPENSVFEGGGVKAIAYPGALLVLEQVGWLKNMKRHMGTSAGSISAAMLAMGYSAEDILRFSLETDFTKFEDGWFAENIWREFEYYGYYSGDNVLKELRKVVKDKLGDENATFLDLAAHAKTNPDFKELFVVTTNFSRRKAVVMSQESADYQNVPIALAVRASMSFPTIFEPVHMQNKDGKVDLHVDGGLYRNFDLVFFDQEKYINTMLGKSAKQVFNHKTLGLRLDSTYDYEQYEEGKDIYIPLDSYHEYLSTLVADLLNQQKILYRDPSNEKRIIGIDVEEVGTADFGIDRKTRLMLIRNGAKAAANHLEKMSVKVDMDAINKIIDGYEEPVAVAGAPKESAPFIMSNSIDKGKEHKPSSEGKKSEPEQEKSSFWNWLPSFTSSKSAAPILQMTNLPEIETEEVKPQVR